MMLDEPLSSVFCSALATVCFIIHLDMQGLSLRIHTHISMANLLEKKQLCGQLNDGILSRILREIKLLILLKCRQRKARIVN